MNYNNQASLKEAAPMLSAEIIRRAREGDKAALSAVYDATHQEVYRTVHALIRSEDLAQDIQQDVYVKAFTHLDQLRDAASLLPWLRRIAVNEARGQLRKKTPVLFSELDAEEGEEPEIPDVSVETSPELALDRKETGRLVREILDDLSDGQRLLVGMYYYEQIPLSSISEELGLNQGTAKSILARSRKKIEQEVRRLEKKGVKLYGLSPLPFLLALLNRSEPAVKGSAKALPAILTKSGVGETVAVHVGKRFFETVLGKAVLTLLTVGVIGGGVAGYHYVKGLNDGSRARDVRLEVWQTEQTAELGETDPAVEETDAELIPVQPPTELPPVVTTDPAPETSEPVPETAEAVPETTESVPELPEPAPEPTEAVPERTEPVSEAVEPVLPDSEPDAPEPEERPEAPTSLSQNQTRTAPDPADPPQSSPEPAESPTEAPTEPPTEAPTEPPTESAAPEPEITEPVEPEPTEPEIVEPEPTESVEPEPVEPEAVEPEPVEPEPTEPEPVEPEPTEPAPVEPEPTEPAPAEPEPTEPEPTEQEPFDPEPTEPAPVEPEPTEPAPVEPEPNDPEPNDPEPVDTEPAEPEDDSPEDLTPPAPEDPEPTEPEPTEPEPEDDSPEDLGPMENEDPDQPEPIDALPTERPGPADQGEITLEYGEIWTFCFETEEELELTVTGTAPYCLNYKSEFQDGIQTVTVYGDTPGDFKISFRLGKPGSSFPWYRLAAFHIKNEE